MNGRSLLSTAAAFGLAALLFGVTAKGEGKKVEEAKLPTSVQRTFREQAKGALIKGYTMEREHGKKVFEAEMLVDGRTKDVQVAEDGTLNEIEEEVPFASLLQDVQAALVRKARGRKVIKVESLTKRNALVAYEATTLNGSKKSEVQVGPTGKNLPHEE